jgi:hypothetical protein
MTELRTVYSEEELLSSHDIAEPLIAGGVRCHGGFDESGKYVSPRTLHRSPAIVAWQEHHHRLHDRDLLDLPLDTWPPQYPNVEQARWLIESGVPEPIITTLTRIGTVEGFGAMIRSSLVPPLQDRFEEDMSGTASAHLQRGLYEAHARDEAGHGSEGGHRQMWFAVRDIAFDKAPARDETTTMLERMGIPSGSAAPGAQVDAAAMRRFAEERRVLPDDIDLDLEILVERMARLLLIEISAFHTFAWAEELLSDERVVAGEGEAGRLVSYIRADETPHVEYLRTVLSEMRDSTWIGLSGRRHRGEEMVGAVWSRAVDESLGARRRQQRALALADVEQALERNPRRVSILEGFHAKASQET